MIGVVRREVLGIIIVLSLGVVIVAYSSNIIYLIYASENGKTVSLILKV
jgi:hypothetical protein